MIPYLKDGLQLFITGFSLDPTPLDTIIEGKENGFIGTISTLALNSLLRFYVILAHK